MIKVKNTKINEVLIIKPQIHTDERGCFFESFNEDKYSLASKTNFIQDNESFSKLGVLRGIHFQKDPFEQSKLVRVIKGKIQDVAVDLRPNSSTYMKYVSIILDDVNKLQLFIPKGFGHAFLTLSKDALVAYKVDSYYNKNSECGIKYDDPNLNIEWELDKKQIILSKKDSRFSYL